MKYFGPPQFKKEDGTKVPTPVGTACLLCKEAIKIGDLGTFYASGEAVHYECIMRAVVGSVGHQMGRCKCFGGTEDDPEGMTRRQAAIAAARLWNERHSH